MVIERLKMMCFCPACACRFCCSGATAVMLCVRVQGDLHSEIGRRVFPTWTHHAKAQPGTQVLPHGCLSLIACWVCRRCLPSKQMGGRGG
jgi:hypothetical protein